jgi:hypothetical protein
VGSRATVLRKQSPNSYNDACPEGIVFNCAGCPTRRWIATGPGDRQGVMVILGPARLRPGRGIPKIPHLPRDENKSCEPLMQCANSRR